MAVTEKNILNRLYFVSGCLFVFALAVVVKICTIQFIDGDAYRSLAEKRTVKNVTIPANRGNIYSVDGSLLATSVPKYDIRFDALTPSGETFNKYLVPLSDSLSKYSGKTSSYYQNQLRKARSNKNRYFLLARNIGYSDYARIRNFPMLSLGAFKGGLIVEQKTKREHPMGAIAQRSVGYERYDEEGNVARAGIDGAFGVKYLRGEDGHRLKQKIGNGQWKPIADYNEVEPKDGYDIYSTIDVNVQDIAHHALLQQLEYYEADHGCVVVMEVKTGEIRAISNLGRNPEGYYYERRNYAVWEAIEPGSTFKTVALMTALEDKIVDTSTVINTGNGYKQFYGRPIYDTRGHGKISVAKALEVSSNIGLATIINDGYSKNPQKFINHLKKWKLTEPLGLPIIGESNPLIPEPGHERWSRSALPSMAYGYNLQLTPLQILTFYNGIANKGEIVKPRFLREVREYDRVVESFDKQVINSKICSDKTLGEIQAILENIVIRGTGNSLYSENFSMAGKTGTARTEYWMEDWEENRRYISSFAGYFPAQNPKYSCIVVIHKPSINKGYYGADVTGPVFKRIAQKIYTETPLKDEILDLKVQNPSVEEDYEAYYSVVNQEKSVMPNVIGMPAMDALALLENMGLRVKLNGVGNIKSQSLDKGAKIKRNQLIELKS